MDGGCARKRIVPRWLLTLTVGVGVLVTIIVWWRSQVAYQSRQRAHEAQLAALRAEEEARRREADREAAKVKTINRVSQLYREIDSLTQLSDRVETSLRDHPRTLGSNDPKARVTP